MKWLSSRFLVLLELALNQLRSLEYPMDRTLHNFFKDRPHLGAQDRSALAESMFTWVRFRDSIALLAGEHASARKLALVVLVRYQGIGIGQFEELITADEMHWLQELKATTAKKLAEAPMSVQQDCPAWLWERWNTLFSDEKECLMAWRATQCAASLDLRINPLKTRREEAITSLTASGLNPIATSYSPLGIRLQGRPDIQKHPLFRTGAIEVQDEGSQLLGLLLGVTRHHTVVDFCAGAGGKTLVLGALMNNQGRLYAFDTSTSRLEKLKPRLKRSSLSNVMVYALQSENDIKVKRLAGKVDRVLVDSPCSGLGTLRRNPDLKWRQSEQTLVELRETQAKILASAVRLLKVGGQLIYATCSVLPEENQRIVEQFLASNPNYRLVDLSSRAASISPKLAESVTGGMLQLWPHRHQTDGFFAACIERIPVVVEENVVAESTDELV
jgi:16S rRNA (cytosine967-C5)-methyltransferase